MVKKANGERRVEFVFYAPKAKNVSIGGDFNNWNPKKTLAKMNKNGSWKARLDLTPGKYQYKFMVDGQWQNDPRCSSCVPNSFGTLNCLIDVK